VHCIEHSHLLQNIEYIHQEKQIRMKRALIDNCRFYKGEKECPDTLIISGKELFWFYEMRWVELNGEFEGFGEYESYGLADFEKDDGVPLTLKLLLFNRYMHWCGYGYDSIPEFKEWYRNNYIP
jgi:hypothetical protein